MSKGLSEAEKRRLLFKNPLGHFDAREFACGWYAAFVNICLTYPVHKIIFRQVGGQSKGFHLSITKNVFTDAPWSQNG